jgi:methyl-accepting chemotaxis protein
MATEVKISVTALVISVSVIVLVVLFWLFARNCKNVTSQLDKKQSLEYAVAALATLVGEVAAQCKVPNTAAGESLTRDNCPALFTLLDALERLSLLGEKKNYVFVVDSAGNQVANGGNPALASATASSTVRSGKARPGMNTMNYVDADGNKVMDLVVSKAAAGGGYVEYKWPLPGSTKVAKKTAYVKPVPHTTWILGSGIYVD